MSEKLVKATEPVNKKRKFKSRVKDGVREILYEGDTLWQACEKGNE